MKLPVYFELEIPLSDRVKDTLLQISSKVTLTSGKQRSRGVSYNITYVDVRKTYDGKKHKLTIRCERPENDR
jgi:hypothetical protein